MKEKKEKEIKKKIKEERKKVRKNSRKSVTWSAVPDAPKLVYVGCGNEIMRGAAAPKGPMTYDST